MKVPCFNCENRSDICHIHCELYKAYRSWLDEVNAQKRKAEEEERRVRGYEVEKALKGKKKYNK